MTRRYQVPPFGTHVTIRAIVQPLIGQADPQTGNPCFGTGHRPLDNPLRWRELVAAGDYWPAGAPIPGSDEPWPLPNIAYKRWRRVRVTPVHAVVIGRCSRSDGYFSPTDANLHPEYRFRLAKCALISGGSAVLVHPADLQPGWLDLAVTAA
jgi:hypothetical protein